MDGARTRGHSIARQAVAAMIHGPRPHAVLLVGPPRVGKTTLALDLAAGLLCTAPDAAARPCGACRACRLVAAGGHPDVHRLGPEGPGRQVVIGGPGSKARGVRDLVADLALLPVEGGARVAIIESAHRLNEDAQAALLKTLEEPPAGVMLILCADAEDPLLPTIRSRCARMRLGPVDAATMATVLADHGLDDPPLAARLTRIAAGRPGLALAWADDAEAMQGRDELARVLIDLVDARPSERLAAIRAAMGRAAMIARLTDPLPTAPAPVEAVAGRMPGGRRRGTPPPPEPLAAVTPAAAVEDTQAQADVAPDDDPEATTAGGRASATERRRAAEALVAVWADVARDLLFVTSGLETAVRDPRLLDDLRALAPRLDPVDVTAALDRLGRAMVLLAGNASPELVLDDLALAWPVARVAP